MTPKEKAEELCEKYSLLGKHLYSYDSCKLCALIAVDEVLEFMKQDDLTSGTASNANSQWVGYWIEVKDEIKDL